MCAGRAETVAVGFEFVAAAKDQFPPGLLRAHTKGCRRRTEILGQTKEAGAARSRSGRLITGSHWTYTPPRELRRPMWKSVTNAALGLKRM
jgi:hypothetical protein